jgi:hypothetical protein
MRFFTARRLALVAFVPALFLASVIPGCADQGEGKNCGDSVGGDSEVCASGLTCKLITTDVYRCCPAVSSNPACQTATGNAGASGTGGGSAAGDAGSTSTAGTEAGGTENGGTESGGAPAAEAGTGGAPEAEAGAPAAVAGAEGT